MKNESVKYFKGKGEHNVHELEAMIIERDLRYFNMCQAIDEIEIRINNIIESMRAKQ